MADRSSIEASPPRTTHRAFGAHAAFLPAPTIGTVTGVGTVLVTSVGQL